MIKKILLYGDLSLNKVDGSSVWLASLAKLLSMQKENKVDILLKEKLTSDILTRELTYRDNVFLLDPYEYLKKAKSADSRNSVKAIKAIDYLRDYSCIIVRGLEAAYKAAKSDLADKLIPYITDFCHDKSRISEQEKSRLLYIYRRVKRFFVQTYQMGEYLKEVLSVDGEKFCRLSPVVFADGGFAEKMPKSIVYAGKIAKSWNITELLEIMDLLYRKDREITLHFIGDKFNRDTAGEKQKILDALCQRPNIVYYGALTKSETTKIINSCELGYSFRSEDIDNDASLELSSKVLEYCFCGALPLLRKTAMHTAVLGEDYPLYVESVEECADKILRFFGNPPEFEEKARSLPERVKSFTPENIYKNILPALNIYPDKKARLLVTGHDLKFIKPLFPYFEKEFELTVQEYDEYAKLDTAKAEKLIKKQDIIFCEWLLYGAQWYSRHLLSFQKLIIRAHKFEISKNYGKRVAWQRVSKLICVSYYWSEQFTARFGVPRGKVTVINNFIDTAAYSPQKTDGYKYNIAMIGILPKLKGFDRAVEILKILKSKDHRFKLYIAGKRPLEFANTRNLPEQREYYEKVYHKIEEYGLCGSVIFTGWVNTADFLKNIGFTLSLSDKKFPESFHIAPFECMASGGAGLALNWEGVEYIYPEYTVFNSKEEIAEKIISCVENKGEYEALVEKSRNFTAENYDLPIILKALYDVIN